MKKRTLALLSISYSAFALLFSLTDFLAFESPQTISEYSGVKFLVPEFGGHILFASIGALPFLDADMIALASVIAIFIDTDHIFNVLGLPIMGRADHSFLFIAASSMLLVFLAQRMNLPRSSLVKIGFVVPVAIFTHFSYDIFAAYVVFRGPGFSFPFFYPYSAQFFSMGLPASIVFEICAIMLAIIGSALAVRPMRFR